MNRLENGFTLIELAIVVLIAGLLTTAAAGLYNQHLQRQIFAHTHENIDSIRASLGDFYARNGRYPCPASPARVAADPQAGREVCQPTATDCKNAGLCSTKGFHDAKVMRGSIPYAELDLDPAQTLDGWNRQFVYVVTADLTSRDMFDDYAGGISLRRGDGLTPLSVNDDGSEKGLHALIISAGVNGKGAYTSQGVLAAECAGESRDVENCDDDGIYISDSLSRAEGKNYFDDMVAGQLRSTFDLRPAVHGSCPKGEFVYGVSPGGQVLCRAP